ncbi:right-handed parallel beta-helix repeat-containing protein [Hymenobacter perfusus]|uniref:T9SS C-terminal target domain-containing protein n=1 Tax=Hymenobacter perfusus TaxID=1236770 RepID=A0A428KJA1_9BACT|nr:right-handed parallel beta-helix repeat-containing protein [Hymenobacter perfusus]RSK46526.1 T9SS C-terminal target domain-containing protein [Hymenobacter perfusus]
MKTHLRSLALSACWTAVGLALTGTAQAQQRIDKAFPVSTELKPAAEQQARPVTLGAVGTFAQPLADLLRPDSFVKTSRVGVAGRPAAVPVVTDFTSSILVKNNGAFVQLEGLTATDVDNDIVRFRFESVPANGILYVADAALQNFQQVNVGTVVSPQQAQFIGFIANNGSAVGTRSFRFVAGDNPGGISNTATYSFQVVNNFPPNTFDFTTATLISNNLRQPLRDLAVWGFSDSDGTVSSFRFTTLPNASTGTLFVDGNAAVANQSYTVANAAQLSFQPAAGYSGTSAIASFTATDNLGATSAEAQLGIPVNKATCGQASVFDFTTRPNNENWKTNRTVTVPNSAVTVSNNLNGVSGYSSTAAAGETTFTTDRRAGGPGYALDWFTDYTSTANVTSTANFYFNRPLKNFSFTMGDLDKGTVADGSAFVDDVTFNGYRADGTVVQLDAGDISLAPNGNNFFSGNNRITGRTNPATGSGSTLGPDGNVTITFTDAIVRLELVYKNLQTEINNPGTQAVYISAFTWCEEADVTTTVTGNTYANVGGPVTYTVTTTNNDGLDVANNVVPTIQLAANLSGVNVTNGSYNSATGLVTFNTTAVLASGASVTNTVSFNMPNGTTTGTARNTAATSDPITGNNNGTQAAAQITTVVNVAPTALNITNSAVAAGSGNQPILPLRATDPQGNSTVVSYRIVTLPGNNNGTLILNGANVTVGQIIPADQAGLLTYTAPATNGPRTFTYSATDDLGLVSNTATYNLPVTLTTVATADLAVTQRVTLGSYRVGQTVTYTVVASSNAAATGVNVNFALPAGLTFVSSTQTGTYNSGTGVWNVGTITANSSTTMTVVARVTQTGDLTTTATIGSTVNPDANTDNNVAVQTINAATNDVFTEDFEGRIIDYCATVSGFTFSDVTTINGREVLTGTIAGGETDTYTTPLLTLTGGTVSFNARASNVGNTNNRPFYTVRLLNENGTTDVTYGPTLLTATANSTVAISVPYTATGVRRIQIGLTRSGATTFLLDDVQVTNATINTRAKDGSNCASNVAPTVADITAPRMSDQAGATSIPALSGTDSDGSIASYVVTTLPDASQGILRLNGVAVTSGQELTPAQAIQLTFDPTAGYFGDAKFTYQAYDNSNTISSNIGTVTIPVVLTTDIIGVVFDDVNYGGGAGRTYSTANSAAVASGFGNNVIGRTNVTVELYDENGTLTATTTTTAGGAYSFPDQFPGNYTVRVVNSTVTSVRATGTTPTGLVPVQTYITEDVNRVGGENPRLADAPVNTGAQLLSALTTSTATPQSISTAQVLNRPVGTPSYEFGFNFDVIVNTNPTGPGSLAQFITNSNGLANTNLRQEGLTNGRETSIFMIGDGRTTNVPAGMRSGLNGGASNGQATITLTAASGALPAVTDAGTTIDGNQQTLRTGDTNATVAESTTGPEVTINFNGQAGRNGGGLYVTGGNFTLNGLGLTGATNGADQGLRLDGAGVTGAVIQNSTFYSNGSNIGLNALSGVTITGNVIRNSTRTDADGIEFSGVTGSTISNNQLVNNAAMGIDFVSGTNSTNTITGNLFKGNGTLNGTQRAGLAIRTVGTGNVVSLNTFTGNAGDGIVAIAGSNNTFSQNSFSGNGGLAIDLANGGTADGDGVTKNASGRTTTSGANGLLNFPVVTQARINGGNLLLAGYAPAGARVEIYVAATDPTNFGEGQTYLTFRTEGTSDDAATGRKSYSALMNGLDQGSETNANMFQFSIPTASLTPAQLAALTTVGARVTATSTVANSGTSEFSGVAPVSNGPLPVTLTSFTAQAAGQDTKLAWATAQEVNNDRFVVERSFDGQTFTAISEVKGQGTKTTATAYSAVDAQAATKAQGRVVYYRLRQVDTDGTEAFSSVQTVSFPAAARTAVEVYPNPATSSVDARLDLSGAAQGTYQVTITDMTGRTVRTLSRQGGTNDLLEVTSLPTGSYLVQVQGNSQVFTKRLIKE